MMLDHLGHHPELFGFRIETYILPHYLANEHKYGDLRLDANFAKLWNDMRSEYPFCRVNKGRPVDLPPDWAATRRNASGVFDRIIHEFARHEGKSRWCEKTPIYALHIATLGKAFPGSVFIHMLRDGRDCAASDHRRWGRHPCGTMFRWKHVVAEGRRQGRRVPDRYVEVRYEDVTNDPELHMRRVCASIGVAFDERVLSSTRPRPLNIGQESKEITKNVNRNTGYFTDSRLQSLEMIGGMCLANLGFATCRPDSDVNPGFANRLWWSTHDTWTVLARQIKNKFTVQKRMTWSLFLARLKVIIRSK